MKQFDIFIDGASQGNPGPSGIGIIIASGDQVLKNISRYIGRATNNIAEYSALVFALEQALIMHLDKITLNTDSQLLYRQLKGVYRVKNEGIRPYFEKAIRLMQGFKHLEINHISREFNKGADKLASVAIKKRTNALAKHPTKS